MKKILISIVFLFLIFSVACKKAQERFINERPAETITIKVNHDTTICAYSNQSYILDASTGNPNSYYNWTPYGMHTSVIVAVNPSYYIVDIYTDTIHQQFRVIFNDCEIYMFYPNSFTPNGDGMNDYWKPSGTNVLAGSFSLEIYNSLDHLLYQTTANDFWLSQGWNGAVDGVLCPAGFYYYNCKYKSLDGQQHNDAGMLQLIR